MGGREGARRRGGVRGGVPGGDRAHHRAEPPTRRGAPALIWLLLDRTAPPALQAELEALGVRSIHVADEDLATADARRLLDAAIEDECLLVTRNYVDYSDLAAAYRHSGRSFPGVLFLPPTPGPAFEEARAISAWLSAEAIEDARNRCVWLTR